MNGKQVSVRPGCGVPCQIVFCLKSKIRGKLNSHRWLFQAFSHVLDPRICIMLEASTVPNRSAFYNLWNMFMRNPLCGCAIGEYKTSSTSSLMNALVASQHFEYKMRSLLDRPWESLLGHRFDSTSALSAYRYVAVVNDREGNGPLHNYFLNDLTVTDSSQPTELLTPNMALAEEGILSFEVSNRKNRFWQIAYVASAYAEVDVPGAVSELIAQRRRWLNGNGSLLVYSLLKFRRVLQTSKSYSRKNALGIQFMYQAFGLVWSWFNIVCQYLRGHACFADQDGSKRLYFI